MDVIKFVALYFLAVNIVAFLSFLIDKNRSKRAKWRIPEVTLISYAIFGGGIGCLLGMFICHHKTRKPLFFIGIPCIIFLQIIITVYFIFFSKFNFTL